MKLWPVCICIPIVIENRHITARNCDVLCDLERWENDIETVIVFTKSGLAHGTRHPKSNRFVKKAKGDFALNIPYNTYLYTYVCKQRQCEDCQQGSTEFSTALIILQSEIKFAEKWAMPAFGLACIVCTELTLESVSCM